MTSFWKLGEEKYTLILIVRKKIKNEKHTNSNGRQPKRIWDPVVTDPSKFQCLALQFYRGIHIPKTHKHAFIFIENSSN